MCSLYLVNVAIVIDGRKVVSVNTNYAVHSDL